MKFEAVIDISDKAVEGLEAFTLTEVADLFRIIIESSLRMTKPDGPDGDVKVNVTSCKVVA